MKRRDFLRQASCAAAAGLLNTSAIAQTATSTERSGTVRFDFHCHPGIFHARGSDRYPGDAAVTARIAEMATNGLSGAFLSTVSDSPIIQVTENGVVPARIFTEGEAWLEYKRQLGNLKDLIGISNAELATSTNDLVAGGRVAAFISCEGGDFIAGASQLDEVYADGVRAIQLVHYAPNQLGDLQTEASQYNGLSALGRDVVMKMNRLGMLVDVAHAPFNTVRAVAGVTDSPIILSHSILQAEPTRPIAARAISADHARAVADTGGVIGAWPSGFSYSFDDFVENTLRLVDVVGVDHVGLGTDMDSNFRPVLDSYSQFSQWTDALGQRGLTASEVDKIAGGNAARVLRAVIG